VEFDPDLVPVVFLPPLLYSVAVFADEQAMRRNMRVIVLLAIGLVLATMGGVAASPTRSSAVAAAVGEGFSASHAGLEFLGVAAGGIAVGLLVGYLLAEIRKRLDDPATEATMSLFSGYAAFLPATSSVSPGYWRQSPAASTSVTAPELQGPQARLRTQTLWEFLTFILNATLFVLIGLQLQVIVDGLKHTSFSTGQAIGYALLAAFVVVAIRFILGFGSTALLRAIDRRPSQRETFDLARADH
jgi:CPA1 family monovalent cation:H+ antiporter